MTCFEIIPVFCEIRDQNPLPRFLNLLRIWRRSAACRDTSLSFVWSCKSLAVYPRGFADGIAEKTGERG